MDCRTALEILEVARPGSGDLADPELAEAAAHVESHAECQKEFLRRQQLDREIGAAMRDVPVPQDLKSRLLAELAEHADSTGETIAVAATEPKTPLQRRTWMRLMVGTAACVVGVIGWLLLQGGPKQIDIASLPNQVAKSIADENLIFENLTNFDDSYTQQWPEDWQFPGLTHAGPKSYPYRQANPPDLAIAMYQFRFKHRGTVTGYLLVLPTNLVNPVPGQKSLSAATTGTVSSASWTDGEFVYICVIPGSHDNLNELVSRLHRRIM